ncbi:MAG: segregation and condensation protein A [Minisyncoccia bacterium]
MPDPFTITTPVFEGPLDLLLELIEKRKLLINDISLASVCDEYISRVEAMEELPLDESSDFVALAATLLLIKSRSLLPALALSEDETRDIKELEYRLAVYKIIKESACTVERIFGTQTMYAGEPPEQGPLFVPDPELSVGRLHATIVRLIEEFPKLAPEPAQASVKKIISLEEMIEALGRRISSALKLSFREYAGFGKKEKQDIIVTFLALLELVKQGIIRAEQEAAFQDITLEHEGVERPMYE